MVVYNEAAVGAVRACLDRWDDNRIYFNGTVEPGNVSLARNEGARGAKGHCLAFLDEDDMWHPAHLEVHAGAWNNSPGNGLVFSHVFFFWEGNELEAYIPARETKRIDAGVLRRRMSSSHRWPIMGTTSLSIDKQAFLAVGGFDIRTPLMDDLEIQYHLACRYPVLSLPEVTVARRHHFRSRLTRSKEEWFRLNGEEVEKKHQLPAGMLSTRSSQFSRHSHLIDWAIMTLRGQRMLKRIRLAILMNNKPPMGTLRLWVKWVVIVLLGIERFHALRVSWRGGVLLRNFRDYMGQTNPMRNPD